MELDRDYWTERYTKEETGWDIGAPSTPLREYIDQVENKGARILIPGAGRAYEAEYAHRSGFTNVFPLDYTGEPFGDLLKRCPTYPKEHLLIGDFFAHEGSYDIILEQTFFCALDPASRDRYVEHMSRLLAPATAGTPGGRLVGVLFDVVPNPVGPPFGGTKDEYIRRFSTHFAHVAFERCHNSIPPRAGRELWMNVKGQKPYVPIDCSLYDHYEAAATRKEMLRITLQDGSEHRGVIVDLFIRDKVEWMRLDGGEEIRLDRIADHRSAKNV